MVDGAKFKVMAVAAIFKSRLLTRDLCLQADTGIQAHLILTFAFWWQVRMCCNIRSDLMTLYDRDDLLNNLTYVEWQMQCAN